MQFDDWGTYYQSIHLNNIAGAQVTNGSVSNAFTTPFSIISSSNGESYTPMTTQFIDVYSGGAPFTYTQELVQRGAEVQDEEIQLVVFGTSAQNVAANVNTLRRAVTNTDLSGPVILSIKRHGQSVYTDFLIHSATVQEMPTYYGRDVKIPSSAHARAFLSLKITRSPYGTGDVPYLRTQALPLPNGTNFLNTGYGIADTPLYGSLVNLTITNERVTGTSASQIGPIMFGFCTPGSFAQSTAVSSGTLAAGATVAISRTVIIDDVQSIDALQIAVVADVQSNEIEMRAEIGDFVTSYVRSIATDISRTTANGRVFMLPPIDIHSIYNGLQDYNVNYNMPVQIRLRNISRTATRTYLISRTILYRGSSTILLRPTSSWNARTEYYVTYNYLSFADQIDFTTAPLPTAKAYIGTASVFGEKITYSESAQIRGAPLRIRQQNRGINVIVIVMNPLAQYRTNPTGTVSLAFSPLFQVARYD